MPGDTSGTARRRLIRVAIGIPIVVATTMTALAAFIWGPPLFSGALVLLSPAPGKPTFHDLPSTYKPLHQGHVDVSTGLYIREDEDLVLSSAPSFVWRRTYLSGDQVSRPFGVGATHNAEQYVIGDPERFKWVELILEDGGRIHFDRLTPGSSYPNAVFGHVATPTYFYGSMVGWTGLEWALKLRDGSVQRFLACGAAGTVCSLSETWDASGHRISFNRDRRGLLRTIDNGKQHLTLDYDEHRRVIRAHDDSQDTVDYTYDSGGRLVRAVSGDDVRVYAYDSASHLLSIREAGRSIENAYDRSGRLARQIVRKPNQPDYVEAFDYIVNDGSVTETGVTENDGAHMRYRFNKRHYVDFESYDAAGRSPVTVSYARGSGEYVQEITVHCMKAGRYVTETVPVYTANYEQTKDDVIQTKCE